MRVKGSCVAFSIRAHLLDTAAWESIRPLLIDPRLIDPRLIDPRLIDPRLIDPRLIAYEVERKRADQTEDPAHAALAAIDARLAEIERQKANVTKAITLLTDPDALAPLTEQISDLSRQHRSLSSERQIAALPAEQPAKQEHALSRITDWAAKVGRNVDALTMRERREVLAALGAQVRVWKVEDRDPRIALDLHLPSSGVLPVLTESDGSTSVCVTTVTGNIQKYLMRQQSIEELGLQDAAGIRTA
jgi:hypothetical protein